ncbi:MAG: response regulator transcription factor [Deltaproteobacteria bacterium]|nr:response regulator transcription factor [Deltaproteobacteria bacterium]
MTDPTNHIRILLAEDNLLTRLGTTTLLETESDLKIVATAADGEEAVALYNQHLPDVAIVDLKMPKLDGVAAIEAIRKQHAEAKILILTHYQGEEDIFLALKAGAMGYVSKEIRGEALIEAIRTVARGRRYLPPDLAERLRDREQRPPLSPREREVLRLISKGLTNQQISETLGISPKTTAIYVGSLLQKLDAQSRTEAVAIAMERGILSAL